MTGEKVKEEEKYCDGFAQDIAGRRPSAPRNKTVEAFPSCPRRYRGYTTHARVTSYNSM
jgi:hypothetical protein